MTGPPPGRSPPALALFDKAPVGIVIANAPADQPADETGDVFLFAHRVPQTDWRRSLGTTETTKYLARRSRNQKEVTTDFTDATDQG